MVRGFLSGARHPGSVILSCVVGVALSAVAEEYPIGCWTFMKQEEARPVEAVVKDWKDLGLTHPMSPEFGLKSDKTTMRRMLDLCAKEGLNLIVHDMRVDLVSATRTDIVKNDAGYRRLVAEAKADWASHPAFAGFHFCDEPRKEQFARVFAATRIVQEMVPGKMCFLNLLPWYDWIGKIVGATDHASYLDALARGTGLRMMSYDLYDHMSEDSGETKGQSVYFENLRGWMEWTKREPGRSFWVTQLCESHSSRVVHSQDDFRWQISTAAAMGAKGIIWYYPEQVRMSWNNRHLPINAFGERTENFNWMSWENRAFRHQFGSEFMRLEIEEPWLVNATGGGVKAFAGDRDIVSAETYGKKQPVLISFFHDADGVRYAAVVLLERRKTAHLTLGLADGVTAASRKWNGEYEPVAAQADPVLAQRHASPGMRKCGIDFAPGQLVLLKLTRRP